MTLNGDDDLAANACYVNWGCGLADVSFSAVAYGGRPKPEFTWSVANTDGGDFVPSLLVRDGATSCDDEHGYICNVESSAIFEVDNTDQHGLVPVAVRVTMKQGDFEESIIGSEFYVNINLDL